jgi:hypothetical protein
VPHSSQPYVDKIRAELLGAENLMDHNVGSVLPGVHTRLSSMQNEILGIRSDMQNVATNFGGLNETSMMSRGC